MPDQKKSKVIIDTNVWVGFLIGKELRGLKDLIVDEKVRLIISDQLIQEIVLVTSRDKLKKYFSHEHVKELVSLLEIIADKIKIKKIETVCRDPKDDFLLALSKASKANYLVTGDSDLLEMKTYMRTKIVSVNEFKEIMEKKLR